MPQVKIQAGKCYRDRGKQADGEKSFPQPRHPPSRARDGCDRNDRESEGEGKKEFGNRPVEWLGIFNVEPEIAAMVGKGGYGYDELNPGDSPEHVGISRREHGRLPRPSG